MLRLKKYPARSPYWYIRGTVAGQRVFESSETTLRSQAEEIRLKRETEIINAVKLGVFPACLFSEAVAVYIQGGGEDRFVHRLNLHFAEKPLKDIGQVEINAAIEKYYPTAKASTINRCLISPFISVARAAIKAELPGAMLRPISRRTETKPVITPATDEHIAKLLPHCSEGLAALITLMTYTGLRTGEALRITKENCKDGFIRVDVTKNGEPRMVPAPLQWAFPAGGFGFSTSQGVGRALRRAHTAAKLSYRDGHEIGRHAFAARWLGAGNSIKGLKEAGGWKKLSVVDQSYGHLELTAVHDVMRELSRKK